VGGATYFRVAATNAGGESMPSEVLAARAGISGKILIVNGFDRLRRQQNPLQHGPTTYVPPFVPNSADVRRVRPLFSNSGDYATRRRGDQALGSAFAFDTTSNEAPSPGR
jgi:hypothetical protein